MKKILLFLFIFPLLFPEPAFAHAFGKLYNLPIPFWMYLYGGAAALIVSFLIIGFFLSKTNKNFSYPSRKVSTFLTNDRLINNLKISSFFLFLLTTVSGLFGTNDSYNNFNMTFFWIIFFLGLTYLTAIVGDVYTLLNPWKILVEWYEKLSRTKAQGFVRYPQKLGYFPAMFFYFLFIWFELIGQTTPAILSSILMQYTIINMAGVYILGKEPWFRYCEFFSVFFRLIAKMAPWPPFVGLLKEKAEHLSLLMFILFMLSSTAFDGFRETTLWVRIYWSYIDDIIRPILGDGSYVVFQTIGLFLSPIVFLAMYLVFITLAKIFTKSKLSVGQLALEFAFSLVPIAFVYNIAHYYTILITQGPDIIRLASDPFGFGWNLFNTANYFSFFLPDANFVWHSQVALILGGHIIGVYLAHCIAVVIFPSHKKALLSQFPMLILMIIYTIIGLWILSQPLA